MKRILTLLFLIGLFFSNFKIVKADSYNSNFTQTSFYIDKFVGKPNGSNIEYVDNLTSSDYRFAPNSDIYFYIKAKNTSDHTLYNLTIKDFIPPSLEAIEGPGNYDANSQTITISELNFNAQEEKTFTIKMRVKSKEKLAQDKNLICENNKASGQNNEVYDDDSSQFCIEKSVENVTTIPKSGSENLFIITPLSSLLGYLGWKLRKIK